MWILKHSKGLSYYLLVGKEHVISRRDGNLILAEDQSISRRHAVITVEHDSKNLGDPTKLPVVTLTDMGSKYGTFINDGIQNSCKIAKDTKQILSNGDVIRFGLQWNEWRLEYIPLVVTASTLSAEERKSLKQVITALGGHIVNSWQNTVTHVTMSSLTLTVKVVCALACGKPIVTPQYWKSYLEAASDKQTLPDCKDFIPPLAETTLNMHEVSFAVNEKRHTLFAGKHFVFSSPHQYNAYSCMVTSAGAKADILEENNTTYKNLIQPHVIVMQYSIHKASQESQVPHSFQEVAKYLKSKGKRLIPESEIGLAILHCSVDRHCNPDYKVTLLSKGTGEAKSETELVLALDTQDSESHRVKPTGKTIIIPESGTVRKPPTANAAMVHKSDEEIEVVSKIKKERLSIIDEVDDAAAVSQKRIRIFEDSNFLTAAASEVQPILKEVVTKVESDEEDLFAFPSDKKSREIKRRMSDDEEDLFAFPSEKKAKLSTKRTDDEEEEDLFAFVGEEPSKIAVNDNSTNSLRKRKSVKNENPEEPGPSSKRRMLEKDVLKKSTTEPLRRDVEPITLDGFLTINRDSKDNNDLEESMMSLAESVKSITVVETKPLICLNVVSLSTKNNSYEGAINFKKFRKVQSANRDPVIRSCDMVLYDVSTKGLSEWLDSVHEDKVNSNEEDEDDEDDWTFSKVSQSTKNKTQIKRR